MGRNLRILWCVLLAVLAMVAAGVVIAGGGNPQAAAAGDRCCFTNPKYSGVCSVTLAEGETCASVLGYLNNPNSTGKGYCGGTSIRGGWQNVNCAQ